MPSHFHMCRTGGTLHHSPPRRVDLFRDPSRMTQALQKRIAFRNVNTSVRVTRQGSESGENARRPLKYSEVEIETLRFNSY